MPDERHPAWFRDMWIDTAGEDSWFAFVERDKAWLRRLKAAPMPKPVPLVDREERMNAAPTSIEMEAEEDNRLFGENWFPPRDE